MEETRKLKLGFVGCGYMGQLAHIANYAQLPNVEMVALADYRPDTARAVAQRYGINEVYATHTELLEKADVDAVVAIMFYPFHESVVSDILRAGKHCLTEKPISIKSSTGRLFQQLAEENNVVYQVGYMKRCDLASRRMKSLIAEWRNTQNYGAFNYLRVSMPPGDWIYQMEAPINLGDGPSVPVPAPEGFPEQYSEKQSEQYNMFINYFIHQVNLTRYLLGEDYTIEYVDPSAIVMVARSDSGVPVVFELSPYEIRDEWQEYYTACFAKGKLELSLTAPMARQTSGRLAVYRNEESGAIYQEPVFPPSWCMLEQARIFVDTALHGKPSISPAVDAVKDLEVAEAYIAKLNIT